MEGMEQLDTIIGFKDKDMGISRELQRAATRSQDSRRRKLLSAFRDISSWLGGVTNSRSPKRLATSPNNSASA
jgi:hypothetical protein